MALKKTCKCGKIIDSKEKMCKECWSKVRRHNANRYKAYNTYREDNTGFYNSTLWKKVSESIRRKFFGCCAICFSNSQKLHKDLEEVSNLNYFIEDGKRKNLIHHIIELKEDESKAVAESNLICVCEKHHRRIHDIYEKGNKDKIQVELLELVARWNVFS